MNTITSTGSPHHEGIARVRAGLRPGPDGEIYLISQENPKLGVLAGRVSINTVHVAALMIYQGSHRVASPAEAEQWQRTQGLLKHDIEQNQAKRDTKYQIIVQSPAAAPAPAAEPVAVPRVDTPLRPPKTQPSSTQNA